MATRVRNRERGVSLPESAVSAGSPGDRHTNPQRQRGRPGGIPQRQSAQPRIIHSEVLGITYIDDCRFKAVVIVDVANAPAFGPPVITILVEILFQASRGPCLQIDSELFRSGIEGSDDNVHMIRATIDRMQVPTPKATCFGNLILNGTPLCGGQASSDM